MGTELKILNPTKMKQFYALTAIAVFFNVHSSAQFIQNFEPINSLTTGCNLTVNSDRTDVGTEVITGTGSLFFARKQRLA